MDVGVGMIVGVELGEKETGAIGTKIKSMRALMTVILICIDRRRLRNIVADACGFIVFGLCAVDN